MWITFRCGVLIISQFPLRNCHRTAFIFFKNSVRTTRDALYKEAHYATTVPCLCSSHYTILYTSFLLKTSCNNNEVGDQLFKDKKKMKVLPSLKLSNCRRSDTWLYFLGLLSFALPLSLALNLKTSMEHWWNDTECVKERCTNFPKI
jgi:hypothetical protein